jgi:cell division septation protein DedD
MADEGLHEIQLNGKQLVFLFMASTVVAVVIFLCGVMVGRGVRAQSASELAEASTDAGTDPTAVTQTPPAATTAASSSSNTPVASQETLTYPSRLEGQEPPEETLKEPVAPVATTLAASAPAPAKPAEAVLLSPPKAPSAKAAPAKAAPATSTPVNAVPAGTAVKAAPANIAPANPVNPATVTGEPAGNGFVVQVAAVNDRREAETIARRLAGKGYPSFVTTPGAGTPRMFRVRIGKYTNRREAESIANRLEKEEQFKPWITR